MTSNSKSLQIAAPQRIVKIIKKKYGKESLTQNIPKTTSNSISFPLEFFPENTGGKIAARGDKGVDKGGGFQLKNHVSSVQNILDVSWFCGVSISFQPFGSAW